MHICELKTNRLLLRYFTSSDLNFVHQHFSNPKVTAFLYDNEPAETIDAAREILDWCMDSTSKTHVRWCITQIDGTNPIGTCGFHRYDSTNNAAEIGYDLFPDYWNNGYMSEALTEMLSYGFENLGLNRIYAYVFINNTASNKLLEKLGFSLEGVLREKHYYKGKYYDHNLYSLLRSDWSVR